MDYTDMNPHLTSFFHLQSEILGQENVGNQVLQTFKLFPTLKCDNLGQDEDNDLVIFYDIIDASDCASDEYEKDRESRVSFPKQNDSRVSVFSDESSDIERSDPCSLNSNTNLS